MIFEKLLDSVFKGVKYSEEEIEDSIYRTYVREQCSRLKEAIQELPQSDEAYKRYELQSPEELGPLNKNNAYKYWITYLGWLGSSEGWEPIDYLEEEIDEYCSREGLSDWDGDKMYEILQRNPLIEKLESEDWESPDEVLDDKITKLFSEEYKED